MIIVAEFCFTAIAAMGHHQLYRKKTMLKNSDTIGDHHS